VTRVNALGTEAVLYAPMRTLKLWLPVVAWAGIILLASNDSLSSSSTSGWFERTFGFGLGFWPHAIIRKFGHLFEYALLAVLAYRATQRLGAAVFVAFLVAVLDESKQSFLTTTRTGSPWDVLLDTCGAFLGTLGWMRLTSNKTETAKAPSGS
jgi:hypothetical protein